MTEVTMRVLDPVDFHGQVLTVIEREGKPYVAMRPIVEGIGLAWPPQFKKLTDEMERWGTVTMTVTGQAADGKEREMICVPLKKLTAWLMTLQPSRMEEQVAQRVLLYQNECDDALWAYWSEGVARNPRVEPKTPAELLLESAQQLVDHERRMRELERGQACVRAEHKVLAHQVGRLVQRVEEGDSLLRALPAPTVAFQEPSVRARINQVVQGFIHAHSVPSKQAGEVWRRLYREFKAAYRVDLVQRARNRSKAVGHAVRPLAMAELLSAEEYPDAMVDLYATAVRLFVRPPATEVVVFEDPTAEDLEVASAMTAIQGEDDVEA